MNIKQSLAKIVIAGAIALPMSSAHALIIDFYNGADLYAQLTTSNSTDFDLHFIGTGSTGAFVNELFMDGPTGTFTDNSTDTTATATYSENGFNGGGGAGNIYDWLIQFPQPNTTDRLTAGEHGLWSIVVTDPEAWNLNKIHINAFDGENSIKLDGCIDCGGTPPEQIPLPGTLLLIGAGLLGLRYRVKA